MKGKKKALLFALATMLTLNVITVSSFAASPHASPADSEIATPRAEDAEWVFRYNEKGIFQKRLWSRTEAKWLTDWMDV